MEPLNSLGLRRDGAVVGWMATHRLRADLVQYTCLFVREGVARGRSIALLAEAVRRQVRAGVPLMAFMMDASNAAMHRFLERRLTPYVVSRADVRRAGKHLA